MTVRFTNKPQKSLLLVFQTLCILNSQRSQKYLHHIITNSNYYYYYKRNPYNRKEIYKLYSLSYKTNIVP